MRAVILETISRGRFSGITDLSVSDSNPIFSAMLNDFHFVVELIGTLHSSDLRSWPKWSKQFLNVAVYLSIFKLTEQNKAWLGCKNKKMLRKPSLMLCSTEMLQDGMNVQIHLAIYFFAYQLLKKISLATKAKRNMHGCVFKSWTRTIPFPSCLEFSIWESVTSLCFQKLPPAFPKCSCK